MSNKNTQSKTQNTPKLRFPGFDGVWEEKKLGKVSDFSSDRILVSSLNKNNFVGVDNLLSDLGGKIESQHIPQMGRVPKFISGDILHSNIRPYLKKAWLSDIEGGASPDVLIIRPKDGVNSKFLYLLTTSDSYFKHVMSGAKGVKMPRGDKNNIMDFNLWLPEISEQQKIADFLSEVDEWIDNLRKQKEGLENYKKGMTQKIFSQQICFKDDKGNEFPEWESYSLGKIGQIKTSSVDKKININEKEIFLLNYMDVYRRNHIFSGDFFQKITAKDSQIESCDLKKGDILFTPSSETPTDIGHSAVVMENLPNTLFSYHLMRFRPKPEILIPLFSGYAFKSFSFYKKLWRLAQGATRFTLSLEAMKEVKVSIPKSLNEQQKIAEFLSSVDELVESKQKQITKAEEWKKGLMQGLFV